MHFYQIGAIVGLTTAAFVAIAPIQANAANYQIQSGVTSVAEDHEEILRSLGLNLTDMNNTAETIPNEFAFGFNIASDTNFTFSDVGGFSQPSGTIKHTGTITFNNQLTVGNFSVGFAATRAINNASGFFLEDTVSLNTILFDLSAPGTLNFDGKNLTLANVQLLFSPEFANILGNSSLTGEFAGTAQIDAKVAAVSEPTNTIALTALSMIFLGIKYKKKSNR
ncbi:hypothetical protein I8751_23490 [Nostocaceae cyanobacterium CENA357]|uniref:Uncharacterized protein n=1 Tax=Atlanticothrix silvestris CENA357 TaxID=1725252 RepID=A0A8J7L619_9CYAN|nr:hypothetical protein [Atlanticothrix silvestris]MBH8555257.1 hypothetical protein [Atlanticothrix silvestris CENA357]